MDDQVLDGIRRMVDRLSDKIVDLEEQLDRYKWRSCKEEMPRSYQYVLVFTAHNDMYTALYHEAMGKWWSYDHTVLDVTHWMSLPKLPKESDEDAVDKCERQAT